MWERIVSTYETVDAPHLRLAISGSAPLPATLFERIGGVLGQPPLERYGTTESGLNVSNLYDGPRQPGGVGYPLPGVEISIDDKTGEISVRGPQVFAGYAGRAPRAEAEWFPTGDLAERDPDTGAVTITGRSKDIIITGGMNVLPREVEDVLVRHAAVEAVAVVGAPSKRWGEGGHRVRGQHPGLHPRRASPLGPAATERLQGSEALPRHRGDPPEPHREGHAGRTHRASLDPRCRPARG